MKKDEVYLIYKRTSNFLGTLAMILLFAMAALCIFTIGLGFHFSGDVFVAFCLAALFETCRSSYIEFKEKYEKLIEGVDQ